MNSLLFLLEISLDDAIAVYKSFAFDVNKEGGKKNLGALKQKIFGQSGESYETLLKSEDPKVCHYGIGKMNN